MTQNRPTFDQMTETQRQKVAEALWSREKPRCQSSLVDDLLKQGGMVGGLEGFSIDDVQGIYADPSDWPEEKLAGYAADEMVTIPDAPSEDDPDADWDEYWESVREAIRNHASENPAEVFEWWEVGEWLAEKLAEAGEVTLRNGYGDWWGRCCTGQSVVLDGVIQRLGAEYAAWALD